MELLFIEHGVREEIAALPGEKKFRHINVDATTTEDKKVLESLKTDHGQIIPPVIVARHPAAGVLLERRADLIGQGIQEFVEMAKQNAYENLNLWKAVDSASDDKKLSAMDQFLQAVGDGTALKYHQKMIAEIIEGDKSGKLQLKGKYEQLMDQIGARMQIEKIMYDSAPELHKLRADKDYAGAVNLLAKKGEEHGLKSVALQLLEMQKARIYMDARDYPNIYKTLEQARLIAPESELGKRIPEIVQKIKSAESKKSDSP